LREGAAEYVQNCVVCQNRKAERAKPTGYMQSFEVNERNALVAVDLLGPLTRTIRDNEHIILIIDVFTRYVVMALVIVLLVRYELSKVGQKEILTNILSQLQGTKQNPPPRFYIPEK